MPLSGRKLALIGAGNMGEALVRGLITANLVKAQNVVATAPRAERRAELEKVYGISAIADNVAAVKDADIVLLGVKPQILSKILEQIAPAVTQSKPLILSVAAGFTIDSIEQRLGEGARIVRAMPNTPALVGFGATAIAMGVHTSTEDLAHAQAIFQAVGFVTVVDESLLDAVTGLSGSGPAYVFMIIEALADAGVM